MIVDKYLKILDTYVHYSFIKDFHKKLVVDVLISCAFEDDEINDKDFVFLIRKLNAMIGDKK